MEDLAEEYVNNQEEGDFDIICILEVIEHATDPLSLVRNAASLLKKPSNSHPGGALFISTINRTAKSFAVAIVGGAYVLGKLPIGTHSWEKFLSPKEVFTMVNLFRAPETSQGRRKRQKTVFHRFSRVTPTKSGAINYVKRSRTRSTSVFLIQDGLHES